jgi:kynurenine formamidase
MYMKNPRLTASGLIGLSLILASASSALAYDPLPGPSPWGPGDTAGATNTQTPLKAKEMALEVILGEGKVYQLGHVYTNDMPQFPGSDGWVLTVPDTLALVFGSQVGTGELLHGNVGQQGTQLDSLAHFSYLPNFTTNLDEAVFYNQFTGAEVFDFPNGLRHLDVSSLKPMVTRAVLLDVKRYANGGQRLVPGQEITVEMIQTTLAAQGLQLNDIQKGDAILINTGHEELWDLGTVGYYIDPASGGLSAPGIGLPVAQLLASRQPTVIGSDNWGIEFSPNPNAPFELGIGFPVHHELLIKNGIPMQESLHLGDLAADVAGHFNHLRNNGIPKKLAGPVAYIFAYIALPVPMEGAAGSPGSPIAIL